MKKIENFRTAISLAMCITFALAFFTGCDKDNENSGGRGAFLGTWKITIERIGTIPTDADYSTLITASSTSNTDILINNILNLGPNYSVRATVNGNNFTIPQQTIQGVSFSGSGTRNGNHMSYSVSVVETGYAAVNWSVECIKM